MPEHNPEAPRPITRRHIATLERRRNFLLAQESQWSPADETAHRGLSWIRAERRALDSALAELHDLLDHREARS